MDLTVPYTFYPSALPHWLAWSLFSGALLGALVGSIAIGRVKRPRAGVLAFVPILLGFLVLTVVASMALTFVMHDL